MANIIQILIQAKDEASQKLKDVGIAAGKAGDEADRGGKGFGNLTGQFVAGNLIAGGVTKVLGTLGDQMKDVFKATGERERGLAQLNSVIKSTGDVSGVTAKQATELADSIQNTTAIDNDAAQAAENMLLTFTNIGKGTFPDATRAVTDMATAMNNGLTPSSEQLSATAIQVGKALNDPVIGVTALQRVGVRMTDTQKEMIKTMVAHGDTMGAQKVILKELNNEFGGSAAAALGTYAGRQAQVKNAITDAKVEIGLTINKALLPMQEALANFVSGDKFKKYLNDVVDATKKLIQFVTDATKFYLAHKTVINEVGKVLLVVAGAVYTVTTAVKIWTAAQAALTAVMDMNPWTLALMAVVAVIVIVIDHWKQISGFINKVWGDIKSVFADGVNFIKQHWDLLLTIMLGPIGYFIATVIKHWKTISDTAKAAFDAIKDAISTAMNFIWGNIIKPVIDVVAAAFHIWLAVVTYVFDVIRGLAIVAWNFLYANVIKPVIDLVSNAISYWATVFSNVFNMIMGIVRAAWAIIWGVIKPVIDAIVGAANWLGNVIAGVFNWVANVASSAWNSIRGAAQGAWNGVVGVWNGAIGWFSGIANGIANAFGHFGGSVSNAFSGAFNGVKGIVTGSVNWIIDRVNSVIHTINNTAGKLPGVPKLGDIPHLYTGTRNFAGGLAIVGDINGRGGELIDLPKGANVYSNSESKQIMNNTRTTTIQQVILGDQGAVKEFFAQLDQDAIRVSKGLSPARGF